MEPDNFYTRRLTRVIKHFAEHPDVSKENKRILQKFADSYQIVKGTTDATHSKTLLCVKLLLTECELDLSALIRGGDTGFEEAERINSIINKKGKYKWSTRKQKTSAIKIICKFLDYNDEGELIRRRSKRGDECLDFISPGKQVTISKTRKNTLLIADIQQIDEVITGSTMLEVRTRAHLWFSLDIGNRASEVENIRIRDITWGTIRGEGHIPIKIDVFGTKNESAEREDLALTVISRYHLAQWLRIHPDKDNQNALLFCPISDNRGRGSGSTEDWGTTTQGATQLFTFIKDAARRAGIPKAKRVNQTGFRSASQTYWLDQGVDPAEIRKRVGHVPGSTVMESAYRAIDSDSSNEAILKATGEIPEDQQIQYTPPDHCPTCKAPTNGLSTYCNICETKFTFNMTETEMWEQSMQEQLINDFKSSPEYQKVVNSIRVRGGPKALIDIRKQQ